MYASASDRIRGLLQGTFYLGPEFPNQQAKTSVGVYFWEGVKYIYTVSNVGSQRPRLQHMLHVCLCHKYVTACTAHATRLRRTVLACRRCSQQVRTQQAAA